MKWRAFGMAIQCTAPFKLLSFMVEITMVRELWLCLVFEEYIMEHVNTQHRKARSSEQQS
jgi:hypothetical protein